MTQMAKTLGSSLEGMLGNPPFQSNPYLVAYDDANDEAKAFGPGTPANLKESALQRHGIRIQDVTTQFLSVQRGTGQDRLKTQIANTQQQGVSENLRLVAALDHGAVLEFGSFNLKGDERLRIGCYLEFAENGARYYVAGVTHDFRQDGNFTTHVAVERGRGHLIRTSRAGRKAV